MFKIKIKTISSLSFCLIVILLFCGGFFGAAKLSICVLEELNTRPFNESSKSEFRVMVLSEDDVVPIFLTELESFKREHPNYSFLVPEGKERFYNERLAAENYKPTFKFEVEQISESRQLIKFKSIGSMSDGTDNYEATDKEVFPKKSSEFNMKDAFLMFVSSIIGGAGCCLVFLFIYRKKLRSLTV